ncbi:hypothetical protein N9595_01915 [Bacteroidia bacterium]|nr:hypothetical protein [Bacteroidia bacterium]
MKNSLPLLDMKMRKWMAGITYNSVNQIDFEVFDTIIREEIACDGQYNKTLK